MGVQNFFVLTEAQKATAESYNGEDVAIVPRVVDNTSPGVGLNLNDNAIGYRLGDPVTLTGKYVAPTRIIEDREYHTYVPDMTGFLLNMPLCSLETETIFAPPEPEQPI
jgi:hypothetical protein